MTWYKNKLEEFDELFTEKGLGTHWKIYINNPKTVKQCLLSTLKDFARELVGEDEKITRGQLIIDDIRASRKILRNQLKKQLRQKAKEMLNET